MMMNIASIKYDSLVNGEGLRTVVFAQGCKHNCKGCFNPHTHEFGIGRDYEVEDLYNIIKENCLMKKVTFSGGDPLYQVEGFTELAKLLKADGYNIWCYTGFTIEEIQNDENMSKILDYVDVIVDGEFIESKKDLNLKYKGSSNQRVIDINKSKNSIVIFEEGD